MLTLIALITRRLISKYWQSYIHSRENYFEPFILNLHETFQNITLLQQGLRPFDRNLIENLLLQQAAEIKGQERADMTMVFEQLGYVAREKKNLQSRWWWRRRDAAIKLGVMQAEQAVSALTVAIQDPIEVVGLAAVRALGQLKSSQSITPVFDMLKYNENWIIGRVLEVLISLGDVVKSEALHSLSSSTKPRVTLLLVQLCGLLKWIEAVPLLLPLISDRDVEIRISTVRAIGSIGDATAAVHLMSALQDKRWEVRAQAAKSLGLLQDSSALKPLAKVLTDKNWWVCYNAAKALWQLGDQGISELHRIISDESKTAKDIAAQVLAEGKLGL
ncbi:HEAT repeat domain-containing protein [Chloroflexota bacterium]